MRKLLPFLLLVLAALACNFPTTSVGEEQPAAEMLASPASTPEGALVAAPTLPPTSDPSLPVVSPTPDNAHDLPQVRGESEDYVVQPNDYLSAIAQRFGITLESLIAANELIDPNQLEVGQVLHIPPQSATSGGPSFKIIPNSELVNGPYSLFFDVAAFVDGQPGYLKHHREDVNGTSLSGAAIIERVATEYSVNAKLLLAVLEYQSGWLSDPNPPSNTLIYPMGVQDAWRMGLYAQLSWAADRLNQGYYEWKSGEAGGWTLQDGSYIPASPEINAGTAGVQHMFSQVLSSQSGWEKAVSEGGLFATYKQLFGYPFDLALEPLVPDDLTQPSMQLPFEIGVPWIFTGGPHGGWGDGSGWAALDFAPPDMLGCIQGEEWVTAVADGVIVRSEDGAVVQDLDFDGYEQTGWTVLYLHMASEGRIPVGTRVQAGDRIGHPSCEGGVVTATHLHLARRYNGEWILASGDLPFNLDGWVSVSNGVLYDGTLQRDGVTVEACECRDPSSMLQR